MGSVAAAYQLLLTLTKSTSISSTCVHPGVESHKRKESDTCELEPSSLSGRNVHAIIQPETNIAQRDATIACTGAFIDMPLWPPTRAPETPYLRCNTILDGKRAAQALGDRGIIEEKGLAGGI
ncbi:hypothetical protein M8818_002763 [Zalaria obscura]|uniref:Uncharacterized protein n=1 Tax=Zalaria obscura TaxID=2024903 RepID=A0ACC3SIV5_9PEZI